MPDTPPPLPLGGDFALGAIGQISLPARDLARAVRFYHDRLRLPLLFQAADMAFFAAGNVRLMLTVVESAESSHTGLSLYFRVDDIRAAYQALVERGVHFAAPPRRVATLSAGELWMAFFRDSEGNALAVMADQKT